MPPLVLLPGLVCDAAVWRGQIALMGRSVLVADYGACRSITAMAELVLTQAPSTFVVAGHSMGGRVAFEMFRLAPARVRAMALLDTGYQPRPAGEAGETEAKGRYALLAVAEREGMAAMARQWVRGMVHPARLDDEALIGDIVAMIERKSPAIFAAQIEALLGRPDATALLPTISCPTTFICGRQDTWSPFDRHAAMAGLVSGADVIAIEEAGHMAPMERPEAVAAALTHWLCKTAA